MQSSLYLYCEGCVIICGYLWVTQYVRIYFICIWYTLYYFVLILFWIIANKKKVICLVWHITLNHDIFSVFFGYARRSSGLIMLNSLQSCQEQEIADIPISQNIHILIWGVPLRPSNGYEAFLIRRSESRVQSHILNISSELFLLSFDGVF